jgi:hypothetical protein
MRLTSVNRGLKSNFPGLKSNFPHDGRMLRLNGALHRRNVATSADLPRPDVIEGDTAIGRGSADVEADARRSAKGIAKPLKPFVASSGGLVDRPSLQHAPGEERRGA